MRKLSSHLGDESDAGNNSVHIPGADSISTAENTAGDTIVPAACHKTAHREAALSQRSTFLCPEHLPSLFLIFKDNLDIFIILVKPP